MRKIFYNSKEVKISDVISISGINVTVTDELIADNPYNFSVLTTTYLKCHNILGMANENWYTINKIYKAEPINTSTINIADNINSQHEWDLNGNIFNYFQVSTKKEYEKQQLLEEAKKKYPIGTMVKCLMDSEIFEIKNYNCDSAYSALEHGDIWFNGGDVRVYNNNKWAEIVKPLFTTKDGKDIYDEETYLYACPSEDHNIYFPWENFEHRKYRVRLLNTKKWNFFSTKETREKWINEQYSVLFITKDNEKIRKGQSYYLINSSFDIIKKGPKDSQYGSPYPCKAFSSIEAAQKYVSSFIDKTLIDYEKELYDMSKKFIWIKACEPKLFYYKILNMIAEDLGRGNFYIFKNKIVMALASEPEITAIGFKTRATAERAKEILGDEIKYFNLPI